MNVAEMCGCARQASYALAASSLQTRNDALSAIARALEAHKAHIFEQNALDVAQAAHEGLPMPLQKRLCFDEKKLATVQAGLRSLISLPDPIGRTQLCRELSPGLTLYRVGCPIGVIGIIFESRPDALVQISCLCLKSGNAVLLKGGREALPTNRALYDAIMEGVRAAGLPQGFASLLETRDDVGELMKMDGDVDLLIPRGSNAFVRYIMDNSRIPVMGHADGMCHLYVDQQASLDMAVRVACDAKMQSVAVCNAIETLLVHADIAPSFLPRVSKALTDMGCTLRGCERTRRVIDCAPAEESDWATEYLDKILSIKVVDTLDEAIAHINRYGSGHTDAIITDDDAAAARFMTLVDSAGVYRNCSTRLADGYLYGFGAEVGISTSKLHARGPVGLEGLCTYKYKLIGSGQTAGDIYSGALPLTHVQKDERCPL